MYEIEYQSDYILVISNTDEEILVISLDKYNPKIEFINTYITGLDNNDIEEAINQVLDNGSYDIEYEIELYRNSKLYHLLEENNQNEI